MKKKIQLSAILCVIAAVLTVFARTVSGFADGYYRYVYSTVATGVSYVMGILPVSVSELLLYSGLLFFCFLVIRAMVRKLKHKKVTAKKEGVFGVLCNLVLVASCLLFLFTVNCGVNYHKTGFAVTEGFYADAYTKEDLTEVCTWLTEEIQTITPKLEKDAAGLTVFTTDREGRAKKAMEEASKTYQSLRGYYPKPKALLVSSILSYQEVTGIYSPFTVEANYNADMPDYLKPFTMCHELSHLKGIMREEEANFAAFLACINASDDTVRYSGLMHAYTYCMNELYEYDLEAFKSIRANLCEGANLDIQNKREFWEKYDTKVAVIANKMNDTYLKANAQTEGTNSYNLVTGLIVEYFQKQ